VAAGRAGIPHVWYVHEFGREDHGLIFDRGESHSIAFIGQASRSVIVNSQAVRKKYAAYIPDEKLRVVYAGVETPSVVETVYTKEDAAPIRLLLLGQVAPGKGQEDAIRAAALLDKQGKKIQLDIVGSVQDAVYFERLQRLTQVLGVAGVVRFTGHTDDPFTQFRAADVALVCSRCEAFGRVTVEAMKTGRPVVGADSGGTAELIRDGQTGFRYTPGDAEDLARKIGILYDDQELLREMGNCARKWADDAFSMEGYIKALAGALQESIRPA
jgi:glycosyltransferase involved in cell wall biosynthesis